MAKNSQMAIAQIMCTTGFFLSETVVLQPSQIFGQMAGICVVSSKKKLCDVYSAEISFPGLRRWLLWTPKCVRINICQANQTSVEQPQDDPSTVWLTLEHGEPFRDLGVLVAQLYFKDNLQSHVLTLQRQPTGPVDTCICGLPLSCWGPGRSSDLLRVKQLWANLP